MGSRERMLNVRLSDVEVAAVHAASEAAGLTPTEWTRLVLLAAAGENELGRQLRRGVQAARQPALIAAWTFEARGDWRPPTTSSPGFLLRQLTIAGRQFVAQALDYPSKRPLTEDDVVQRHHLRDLGRTRVLVHGDSEPYEIVRGYFDAVTGGLVLVLERLPPALETRARLAEALRHGSDPRGGLPPPGGSERVLACLVLSSARAQQVFDGGGVMPP